jgi:hypothetical protein
MERLVREAVSQDVTKTKIIAALAPGLFLIGCDRTPSATINRSPASIEQSKSQTRVEVDSTEVSEIDGSPRSDTADGEMPYPAAPVLTPNAERTATGARNVLLSFARAIELGEFEQARALLSRADKQKWSSNEFSAIFADLDDVIVAVPTGILARTADSTVYNAPIAISGSDADGRPVRIEGEAVLKRAREPVDSSADQLRWHFDSLTLDITH